MRSFSAVVGSWLVAGSLFSSPAAAQDLSELEQRALTRALGRDPDFDLAPQGKRIESVEIKRQEVFDDDDPVPDFVNWFHFQSRESVIRRELLFEAGDRYDPATIEETLRNLQLIPQFGVVVTAALKGTSPDQVRVVVVVRDVWSLRLNYELQGSPTNLDYLLLNLSEDNFLGTRARVGVVYTLQPDRYSLGALLAYPRLAGSKIDGLVRGGVYVNRDSGEAEGSYGSLVMQRAFVALRDKWAFLLGTAWNIEQTRIFQNGVPVLSPQGIPIDYASRVVRAGGEIERAFGVSTKTILTGGLELVRREFSAEQASGTSDADFAAYVHDELPVSDTRLSPYVQVRQKTTRFLRTRDVETLELQESFSLGQVAALRLYPAAKGAGSSRTLLGSVAWLGYTWPLRDGFLRVIGSSSTEIADHARHQAFAQGALRVVSPRIGFLRAVVDTVLASAYQNYLNRKLVLGGETRPRGYVTSAFRGPSGFAGTLELRSSAINVLSARIGGVAFYDLAGAGEEVEDIRLHQSLGAGVRILFPQVNRICFRLDWAAPLTPGPGRQPDRPLPGAIYFTFGQAFDLPQLKLPEILGAETTLLELSK